MTETIDNPGNKKLEMECFNLGLLSRIEENTRRRVFKNRYGANIEDKNKTHEYYIVNWHRPPQKIQEDTNIFQADELV